MKINPVHRLLLNLMIIGSLVLLGLGVFMPMMTLNKFYFFDNQVSLYSALNDLLVQKEWLLFGAIFIFSIIFPIFKSLFLFLVLNTARNNQARHRKLLNWLANLGKWSMLDVFVVALLLVTVKLDMIANVQIHWGIYAFGASVLLTMLLTQWVNFQLHNK